MKKFSPRIFQQHAFDFMLDHPRCALFADMGMGKTSGSLLLLNALDVLEGDRHTLVIAPKRVARITWPDEIAEWQEFAHMDYSLILGTAATRKAAMRKDRRIHIINYDNIPWLLKELNGAWPWHRVIVDESSKMKSHSTLRFKGRKALKEIRDTSGNILQKEQEAMRGLRHVAHRSERWVNMTGTPTPNGLEGLWSQTYLLDQGQRLERTITRFRDRWFYPDRNLHGYHPLPGAQEEILDLISDICLTLRAEDYLDLPEVVPAPVWVEMSGAASKAYRRLERDLVTEIEGHTITAANAGALAGKLLQAANGAVYTVRGDNTQWATLHDEKLEALDDILDEVNAPVLVAYFFHSDYVRLKQRYPQAEVMDDNPVTAYRWNKGEIPILLIHPDSAGHGLNLQHGGHHIVFFSLLWNLESYQQVIERIGAVRQFQAGLNRPVFIYYIMTKGTMDAVARARLNSKARGQDAVKDYFRARHLI